jgi:hypothetical protein
LYNSIDEIKPGLPGTQSFSALNVSDSALQRGVYLVHPETFWLSATAARCNEKKKMQVVRQLA